MDLAALDFADAADPAPNAAVDPAAIDPAAAAAAAAVADAATDPAAIDPAAAAVAAAVADAAVNNAAGNAAGQAANDTGHGSGSADGESAHDDGAGGDDGSGGHEGQGPVKYEGLQQQQQLADVLGCATPALAAAYLRDFTDADTQTSHAERTCAFCSANVALVWVEAMLGSKVAAVCAACKNEGRKEMKAEQRYRSVGPGKLREVTNWLQQEPVPSDAPPAPVHAMQLWPCAEPVHETATVHETANSKREHAFADCMAAALGPASSDHTQEDGVRKFALAAPNTLPTYVGKSALTCAQQALESAGLPGGAKRNGDSVWGGDIGRITASAVGSTPEDGAICETLRLATTSCACIAIRLLTTRDVEPGYSYCDIDDYADDFVPGAQGQLSTWYAQLRSLSAKRAHQVAGQNLSELRLHTTR